MATRLDGSVHVNGALTASSMSIPDGSVDDDAVEAGAGIAHTKLEHQHRKTYGQSGTAAAATVPLSCIYGDTGEVLFVEAGSIVACVGDSTITVDVKKNGTTILSAPIVLNNSNTARVSEAGTVSVSALADGDLLEAVVTVSAGSGTLGTGLFVTVGWAEDAQ